MNPHIFSFCELLWEILLYMSERNMIRQFYIYESKDSQRDNDLISWLKSPVRVLFLIFLLIIISCSDETGETLGGVITGPAEVQIGSLSIMIEDQFGEPLSFALVEIFTMGIQLISSQTNENGLFEDEFEVGTYEIVANKSGFKQNSATVLIKGNFNAEVLIVLKPQSLPSFGTIDTRVIGFSGNTLEFEADIFVVDEDGNEVSSLTDSQFDIREIQISDSFFDFSQQEVSFGFDNPKEPYSAAVLLDQSSSITDTDPNDSRIQGLKIFFDALGSGDEATLSAFASNGLLPNDPVTFWGEGFLSQGFKYFGDLDNLSALAGGGTPLFQSILIMIDFTSNNANNSNKAVVVFTDGSDTEGGAATDDIVDFAVSTNVNIFTVGLGDQVDISILSEIAAKTGGTVMWTEDARQLVSIYSALGNILRGSQNFYRTRWNVSRSQGNFGSGNNISTSVEIDFMGVTRTAPFFVEIP